MKKRIQKESEIGLQLDHPHLIEFHGLLEIPGRGMALVLELATGGSLVTHEETWQALRHRFVVCWLRAEADDHWNRVRRQGDSRPMAGDPMAMDKLRTLLEHRAPLYAKAHHVVDTSACDLEHAIEQVERLAWPVLVGA